MFGFDRLIAWHDIHLLIEQMSASELQVLADTATRHQLAAICRETLVVATQHFGTRMEVPLDEVFPDSPPDLVARYQRASAWRRRWLDLRAVPGTRARLAYMREHIAPPADYMRTRYPGAAAPLAWLRARRLMAGLSHSRQRA
jgi:hypothetical protein